MIGMKKTQKFKIRTDLSRKSVTRNVGKAYSFLVRDIALKILFFKKTTLP